MVSISVFSVIGFAISFLIGWFVGNVIYRMEFDGIDDDKNQNDEQGG